MTEHFSFFDAIQDSNGHYDREYNAQQFTDYFKSLVTTGVMKGAYNQLEVTANGSNMTSSVKSGIAFVEGRYYYNDALLELTHDTEVIGLSRIDRIVVLMDLSTEARYVKTFIKKGVPATSPAPPTLTQTTQLYEISLAQILVVGGQTYIAANAVTDERGKDIICPWAGSKILPNFDNNTVLEIKANKQQEDWIFASVTAPWANIVPVKFYKDEFGVVHVVGVVRSPNETTEHTAVTIFNLPVEYRPIENNYFLTSYVNPVGVNSLTVASDGRVYSLGNKANNNLTINFSFRAEQ